MYPLRILAVAGGLVSLLWADPADGGRSDQDDTAQQVTVRRDYHPRGDDPFEAVLWRGIDAMYSYRFGEAEAALDSAMSLNPHNPVAPFVAVANLWQKMLTEQGYRASHEALLESIKATIPRYEAMIDRDGRRADILLYLGSTYGLRARVYLADKNWFAVLYSGLKGWSLVRQAYQADTTLADAFFPIGVFDYYAGMSAAPIQLAARMFGMDPDRQVGALILQRAVRSATYSWVEAASTLSILYLYIEDDPAMAYRYTDLLVRHYPENYYFNFLLGEELVRTGRLEQARRFLPRLQTLVDQSHPNQRLEWMLKYAALEAALAHKEGQPDVALERCRWVIDHYEMEFDWHLGIAHFIRGRIRESRGDLAGAREDYRVVAELDNKTYVVEQAQRALERLKRAESGA